jgi:hypothetical protein
MMRQSWPPLGSGKTEDEAVPLGRYSFAVTAGLMSSVFQDWIHLSSSSLILESQKGSPLFAATTARHSFDFERHLVRVAPAAQSNCKTAVCSSVLIFEDFHHSLLESCAPQYQASNRRISSASLPIEYRE